MDTVGARRVLFINAKRLPPLGADTAIHLAIIRSLDRARVAVFAACVFGGRRRPTPTYAALRDIPDVTIRRIDLGRELSGGSPRHKMLAVLSLVPAAWHVLTLGIYIRRHRIEVIHSADRPRDAAVTVLLGRLTSTTSVVHVHAGYDRAWMQSMLQWAIRRADALIAISTFVAGTLVEVDRDPRTVHVVSNGIDLESWDPSISAAPVRAELGIGHDRVVVLTTCRLFRAKGVSELVQAFAIAADAVSNPVLLVAGAEMESGYLAELEAMVRDAGLGRHVSFLGHRRDVAELMAAADIFVMPSHHEPFGLVYTEAMAMELPVVALDEGGSAEIVEHGVTGLLSPYGDVDAIARHLTRLMLDPALRSRLGSAGRRRVEQRFTTARMASGVADVFDALVVSEPDARGIAN